MIKKEYTLRIAKIEDLEELLPLLSTFKGETVYKDTEYSIEKVRETIKTILLGNGNTDIIVLSIVDNLIKGYIWGSLDFLPFSYVSYQASEKLWWVDKEYRKTGMGKALFDAFEFWANKLGASQTYAAAPTKELEDFYLTRGYTPLERVYVKTWQQDS